MAHLADILIMVRRELEINNKDEMADYLGIAHTTYKYYETKQRNPKHELYKIFKAKFDIDLETSITEGKICFFGFVNEPDARLKAAKTDPNLHYHIPVYINKSVQDIHYEDHTQTAFIIYPGTKPHSICINCKEQFIICRKISIEQIAAGKKYIVVMKDGQEKILTSKHIDTATVKSLFLISKTITEEEMISRKIENLF